MLLLAVLNAGHAQPYVAVWFDDTGAAVAWLYPEEELLLAVASADRARTSIMLSTRMALLAAQRTIVRAHMVLDGTYPNGFAAEIRGGRIVRVDVEEDRVRVHYAVRVRDIVRHRRDGVAARRGR